MKKIVVISLGGSLIIPEQVDIKFLKTFKETITKNTKNFQFIIVCGGGSIARKYISALKEVGKNEYLQGMSGISATRMNARFLSYFFGKDAYQGIPNNMKHIKNLLLKNDVIFCGALRYAPKQTSDATSAKLAHYFKTEFINMTNVSGLYNKDPIEHKDAKFIPSISWKDFDKMASKNKYFPGQHFVLDQTASKIIMKDKITTYLIGKDSKQIENIINKKPFKGTIIKS